LKLKLLWHWSPCKAETPVHGAIAPPHQAWGWCIGLRDHH
jgi:hypothetical protein